LKLIETLEERQDLSAVGGLYFTKGEGGCAQIWGDPKDPLLNYRPQVPIPETVQECCGLGQGFTMFRLSMFKDPRLRKPWFVTQKGINGVSTSGTMRGSTATDVRWTPELKLDIWTYLRALCGDYDDTNNMGDGIG
jgi:hypothetical protein